MNLFQHNKKLKTSLSIVLIVMCVVCFAPSLFNGFMDKWDDQWQVMNPYTVSDWNWKYIRHLFAYSFHGQYSPLNQLLYWAIFRIDELNPFCFHLTSLLLHIVNTLLLFTLLQIVIADKANLQGNRRICVAFIATALFAIHPLQVESIAWVSASKILLSTSFYLGACLCYVKCVKQKRMIFYFSTFVCFVCAYFSKEQSVTLPLMLTLFAYLYKENFTNRWQWVKHLVPFYLASLCMGLLFMYETRTTGHAAGTTTAFDYAWWQRGILASYSLTEYFCKYFFPYHLQFKYFFPSPAENSFPLWMSLYPLLVLIIIGCIYKSIIRNKWLLIGLLVFIIHILPVLHIVPIHRQHVTADRYMYLPLIGLSLCMAYYFDKAYSLCKKTLPRRALLLLFAVLCLTLGTISFQQSSHWKSTETLYEDIRQPDK